MIPLCALAIGRGVGQPPMMGLVSIAATPETRGLVMGTFQSSASLARVFGPAVAGACYAVSPEIPFLLAGSLMIVAVALAVGLARNH